MEEEASSMDMPSAALSADKGLPSTMDLTSAAAPPALIEAGERMIETERGREGERDRCIEKGTVQAAASQHYNSNQVSSSSSSSHDIPGILLLT